MVCYSGMHTTIHPLRERKKTTNCCSGSQTIIGPDVAARRKRRVCCSNLKLRNRSLLRIKIGLSSLVENNFFLKIHGGQENQNGNQNKGKLRSSKGGQKISSKNIFGNCCSGNNWRLTCGHRSLKN